MSNRGVVNLPFIQGMRIGKDISTVEMSIQLGYEGYQANIIKSEVFER